MSKHRELVIAAVSVSLFRYQVTLACGHIAYVTSPFGQPKQARCTECVKR